MTSSASTPVATASYKTGIRHASLVAGIALALMAVLAGVANFAVITPLVTPGDASATATAIAASEPLFRGAIAMLVVVVLLDLIVAAALRTVFASVNAALSSAAGWFRVAYSAVFLVAIAQLAIAVTQLDTPDAALASITAFTTIWHVSLIIFAGHLLLVGYLAFRSGFVPRVFGILLLIAGAGYLVDGFMAVLVAQPPFTLAAVTFVGEVALIFWLLIAGGRGRSAAIA
ncbi:MAG: DUF4386 domain-containing protein [Actinobacteria bacterium]|nr:DUF4386 domain-containing protein [Actinomycetota bacterium]